MTDAEKTQYVQEIGKILKEYLTTALNYPNCSNQEILKHLVPMWNLLVHNQKLKPGMTFEMFHKIANEQYLKSEIDRIIGF